jgi:hypothetical protein
MKTRLAVLAFLVAAPAACGGSGDAQSFPAPPGASPMPTTPAPSPGAPDAATSPPPGGGPHDGGATDAAPPPPASDSGPRADAGGSPCYSEVYHPNANIDDLRSAYTSSAWLSTSLEVMNRRYSTGHFVLDAEQNDSQLSGFADPSSWPNLMQSLMTMVHEESHGYDFDHTTGATTHTYALRDDLLLAPPQLTTWPRSEILPLITDNATSSYDQTYLTGTQGTYDVVFLGEEWNAYTNGLAAITAVAKEVTSQISARDGAVCHLYYAELYLRIGRTNHPDLYAALKANPDWQKFFRYEWARVHFWDHEAAPYPDLDIGSAPIWAHVNDPANLDEIRQFTGDTADVVACHP